VLLNNISNEALSASHSAGKAAATAQRADASDYALCEAGNVLRRESLGVWYALLADLGPPKT